MSSKQASQVFTLSIPIEVDGATITQVTIWRPKMKHLRAMRAGALEGEASDQLDQSLALVAGLTDLPEGGEEELDLADFEAISKIIEGFFPERQDPKTGAPSSQKPPTG